MTINLSANGPLMTHFKYNTTQKCTKYIKLIVKQYSEIGTEYANTKNP